MKYGPGREKPVLFTGREKMSRMRGQGFGNRNKIQYDIIFVVI
jgi:hypothetical protein